MKRVFYTCVLMLAASAATGAQTAAPRSAPAAAPANESKPAAVLNGEDCGCEQGPLPEVLAVVNGVKITPKDLSPQARERVAELQRQVVEARRQELDLQINSLLLEAEAKKRGVTSTKVLEDEVIAKAPAPTEAEALAFFNQNKARIEAQVGGPVEFAKIRENIVAHMRAERRQELAAKFSERLRAAAAVKLLVKEATPPATPAARARVFATVAGRQITSGDIEDSLAALVYGVQEEVFRVRQRDVELKVNDTLLSQEAQKRQMTTRALLEAEVDAKMTPVTEARAQEFYNQNKERINGDFAKLKDSIVNHLRETESHNLLVAFAERLRKEAALQTHLVAPVSPVFKIATDDQPAKGGADAAVTIVY